MSASVIIMVLSDTEGIALVYFGTDEAFDKWSEELIDILLTIEPL